MATNFTQLLVLHNPGISISGLPPRFSAAFPANHGDDNHDPGKPGQDFAVEHQFPYSLVRNPEMALLRDHSPEGSCTMWWPVGRQMNLRGKGRHVPNSHRRQIKVRHFSCLSSYCSLASLFLCAKLSSVIFVDSCHYSNKQRELPSRVFRHERHR